MAVALTVVHSNFSSIQDHIKNRTDFWFKALIFIYSVFSCLHSTCRLKNMSSCNINFTSFWKIVETAHFPLES